MMDKHIAYLYDMYYAKPGMLKKEFGEEKITDSSNYLLLLVSNNHKVGSPYESD